MFEVDIEQPIASATYSCYSSCNCKIHILVNSALVVYSDANLVSPSRHWYLGWFLFSCSMETHNVSEDVARKCIHFPDWLYEVKELEVEE